MTSQPFVHSAKSLRSIACVSVLVAHGVVLAADKDAQLADMVVTATKSATSIREVPAAVSVITRAEIEKSSAVTVDQLLQGVPGVYAARMDASSPNRIAQTYSRGFSGSGRTLVLIDGVPMNVLFDGQVDWSQLKTSDVERVEVVRGAASGLYGGNAMGGVINIITRTPPAGIERTVFGEYGTNNTRNVGASIRGRSGDTGFALSASQLDSDGYDMWTVAQKLAVAAASRHKMIAMGTKKTNVAGKLTHDIDTSNVVDVNLSYLNDINTGFYDISGYEPQRREQWLVSGRYRHFTENSETSLVLYTRLGKQWADSPVTTGGSAYNAIGSSAVYDDNTFGINAQSTIRLSNAQQITIGADYLDGDINVYDHGKTTNPGRVTNRKGYVTRTGLFAQDEIKLGQSWIVNVAGRIDYWKTRGSLTDTLAGQPTGNYPERKGSEFSPKFALLYKLAPDINLRASAGKAFKLPEQTELYSSSKRGTITYWGNPNLVPESTLAYEAGLDYYIGNRGHIKTTLYKNNAKNFVYSITRDATNNDKVNIEGVETRGLEVEAAYKLNDIVGLTGAYTYNDSVITAFNQNPALVGKQLTNVPKHHTFLRADLNLSNATQAFVTWNYVGTRYAADNNSSHYRKYATVDVGLSQRISADLDGRLTVLNVGDRVYDGNGYMAPGRVVTASLKYKF
jgi:outer membrane receptor protein involved in Fe transport